jgi:hypothetical protein
MQRVLIAAALLFVLAAPAHAQEGDDMLAGFKLGKFHATAKLLAADLIYLDALVTELHLADITDENYSSGVITDDDVFNAQLGLAYAIWRIQFMILPACESGLADDSFTHPALEQFKEPTQDILRELERLSNELMEGSDFSNLVDFTTTVSEGGFAEDLMTMAAEAAELAGDEEDMEDTELQPAG